jgi:hypothetical protein
MEVPEEIAPVLLLPIQADSSSLPGAMTSTQLPLFE